MLEAVDAAVVSEQAKENIFPLPLSVFPAVLLC